MRTLYDAVDGVQGVRFSSNTLLNLIAYVGPSPTRSVLHPQLSCKGINRIYVLGTLLTMKMPCGATQLSHFVKWLSQSKKVSHRDATNYSEGV